MPPVTLGPFMGMYRRDTKLLVPPDHLWDAQNADFEGELIKVRNGITSENTVDTKSLFDYARTNLSDEVSSNLLALQNANLVDTTTGETLASSIDEFHAINFVHKVFIATRSNAIRNSVKYYDGENYVEAGLDFDESTIIKTVNNNVGSGDIYDGRYHIGYVLETDTGFLSVPYGLADYVSASTPGSLITVTSDKSISVTLTGTLPSNVVKVHYIITSAIADGEGGHPFASYKYYFIPDGVVDKGDASSTKVLDFFPPNLLDSADYLFNQHDTLAGADGIGVYSNRLLLWGGNELSDQSILRVSRVNDPESFSKINGFLVIAPEVNEPITNVFSTRDVLYITKNNSTYAASDNGASPATWPVVRIDKGLGAERGGVSIVLDTEGPSLDSSVVNTAAGLCWFDGVYKRPEISFKIEKLWGSSKVIVRDPRNKKIYALLGNVVYVCNHANGPSRLRWSRWTFDSSLTINHMIINSNRELVIATSGGVYKFSSISTEDINMCLQTGYLAKDVFGVKHHNDIHVSKDEGVLAARMLGRKTADGNLYNFPTGQGVYRMPNAYVDDNAQIEFIGKNLERAQLMVEQLWGVPLG